eukprot:m.102252 g.102252  ORF g.102252 m.102252 type:complete len:229 (+) comp37158_c0_seq2:239-925(+)
MDREDPERHCTVEMYEPPADVISLDELSQCCAARAYLVLHAIPFEVKEAKNAESMSFTGKFPVFKTDRGPVEGFSDLIQFCQQAGDSVSDITSELDDGEKAQLEAYVALLQETLLNAEIYLAWIHKPNAKVMQKRYGSFHPWPLNHLLPWLKVKDAVHSTLQSLESFLGTKEVFFPKLVKFTELECLVHGHVHALRHASEWLPDNFLSYAVKPYRSLLDISRRCGENQ